MRAVTPDSAWRIGAAALQRVRAEHTYAHRAELVEQVLGVRRVEPVEAA
jgi:spore maturation protein CgeB